MPVDTLTPGEYVLRITATAGDRRADRTVRFKIVQ
jgi:hypothetical protein